MEEGLRRSEFAYIDFRDSAAGRQAYMQGSSLAVWEVAMLLRDYDGTKQVTVLTPRDKIGFYGPQPVRSRPRPPVRATILPPGGAEDHWATVYVQDVYNGLEPVVQRGEVKQIAVVQDFLKLRREALLANPLLDFDKLMVVKRSMKNLGLPQNWQGNCALPRSGYDNEIATVSIKEPEGPLTTLYRPEAGRFVR